MTTTATEISQNVRDSLTDVVDDFDVDSLVAYLVGTYDLTGDNPTETVDDIPEGDYWAIVARYDTTGDSSTER